MQVWPSRRGVEGLLRSRNCFDVGQLGCGAGIGRTHRLDDGVGCVWGIHDGNEDAVEYPGLNDARDDLDFESCRGQSELLVVAASCGRAERILVTVEVDLG